jgi:hypothetical protein
VTARAADQCRTRCRDRGGEQLAHPTADTGNADPWRRHDPHSGCDPAFATPPITARKTSGSQNGRMVFNI